MPKPPAVPAPSSELEELLASGKVKAALLLPEGLTDREIALVRQAWEAGLKAGRAEAAS